MPHPDDYMDALMTLPSMRTPVMTFVPICQWCGGDRVVVGGGQGFMCPSCDLGEPPDAGCPACGGTPSPVDQVEAVLVGAYERCQ